MKPFKLRRTVIWALQRLWLVVAAGACTPFAALAHGAHVQSRTTSAVEIQAAYDSGEPMAAATVQVFAPDDPETPRFTGVTDAAGRFVFIPPQPGDWEVSVRQAGHGDIAVIPVEADGVIAAGFTQPTGLTPLQRGVVLGAVAWGCVGTALFCLRGKR
ncbi:MAG: carboxypeptidase-like regulatory domain-containing protein [Cyanobacteria bacterium P01_D01_bin.115]